MTKQDKKKIREFILELADDVESMDYINTISFPFTSKYIDITGKYSSKRDIIRETKKGDYDFEF